NGWAPDDSSMKFTCAVKPSITVYTIVRIGLLASLDVNAQKLSRGVFQILLDAEVALGSLDAFVAEGQLDLLDRDFSLVGEFGEGSSNVVGRELEPDCLCSFRDDEVDGLRGKH